MVYGTYNYSIHGVCKPTILGGTHIVAILTHIPPCQTMYTINNTCERHMNTVH